MPIAFACPNCQQPLRVGDEQAGAVVACPRCQKPMRVPQPAPPVPAPPAAPVPPPPPVPPPASRPPEKPVLAPEFANLGQPGPRFRQRNRSPNQPPIRSGPPRASKIIDLPKDAPPEALDLGEPFDSLDQSFPAGGAAILALGAGAVCGGIWVLAMIGAFVTRKTNPGPVVLVGLPILALAMIAAAAVLFVLRKKLVSIVWACPDGLVRLKGDGFHCTRWVDVRTFQAKRTKFIRAGVAGSPRHKTSRIRVDAAVTLEDGTKLSFAGQSFIDYMQRRIVETQVPRKLEHLRAGKTVELAPFTITAESVTCDGKTVRWSEVEDVYAVRNEVVIQKRGGKSWARIPLEDVPFAIVVGPLLQVLAKLHGPGNPGDSLDFQGLAERTDESS